MKSNPDGSYTWECRIPTTYHRHNTWIGFAAVLAIVLVILLLYILVPSLPGQAKSIWLCIIPIGIILIIALPLLYLQSTAKEPHEQYLLTEEFVKSGYGKAAIFTRFEKTKYAEFSAEFIELYDGTFRNRIYAPAEELPFIQDYITKRLPETTQIYTANS
ncbi:MAG: hypothetical protein IJ242_11050 [Clostridia bacterium]|nr:hypothetical protein [Clostridia bacterium]